MQVVQATMIRDRQHGPVVELNRIALRRSRATGKASVGVNATVFAQMANKLPLLTYDVLMLPHRTWKVKFVGMVGRCLVDRSTWLSIFSFVLSIFFLLKIVGFLSWFMTMISSIL